MMKRSLLLLVLLIFCLKGMSQEKKPIPHSVYDSWKEIKNVLISNDGRYVAYEINPQKGDGWLFVKNVFNGTKDSIARGYNAVFSPSSDFIAFKIKPQADTVRKLKLAKKKDDDLPKDSLGVFVFKTDSIKKFPRVKTFKIPELKGAWLAIHFEKEKEKDKEKEKSKEPKDSTAKKDTAKAKPEKKEKKKDKKKSDGTELMVFKPMDGKSMKLKSVTDFSFAREGEYLQVIASKPDSIDSVFVYTIPFKEFKSKAIYSAKGYAKNPAVDRAGKQMSFLASSDTSQNKMWSLMFYDIAKNKISGAVDSNAKELPKNWCPSPNGSVKFSDDGKRLFFETAKKPDEPAKDTLTDEEKCKLDLWSWDDDRLQSQQIHDLDQDLKRTYLAVYDIASSQIFQLGDPDLESVNTVNKGNGDYALGTDEKPYSVSASWEWPSRRDIYLVNLKTGERKLLLKNIRRGATLSPSAQFVLYYTDEDSCWNVYRIKNNDFVKFAKPAGISFADEEYDMPSVAPAYGFAGWLKDEKYVLINDRYDIWKFDLANKEKPLCITSAEGRKNKTEYRYQKLNKDDEWIDAKSPILLKTYNEKSKAEGYARITLSKLAAPEEMLKANARITGFVKAKDEDLFILQKQSVKDYPDLWLADIKFVNPAERITNANPQQKDYNWSTVESVYWKAYDGKDLEGMLYKPENFNPAKKYPVIVYFYEKNSDNFNTHYVPSPSRSIVNPTVYASNGYLVFVPDIVYKKGQPGKDAYNCIMSGVDKIVKLSYVDSMHMALQGQSWGGYQTAYLITQTNRFCAAMAGAAVTNMTSAYGGIRLESGVVRMHQYENSQSRIGYTLWDSLQLYIQNSPLFYADKIQTPLLMMNNDNDGAVPWQQGIELLCAMRRLNKPAWMLVYNGEEHNLTKRPTRQDLSIRMMQFFDHYLKGAPAPQWMIDGIPAVDKGKKFGYEISK